MEAVDEFNEAARFMIRSRIDFIVNEDKEMAGKVRIVGKGGAPDTNILKYSPSYHFCLYCYNGL